MEADQESAAHSDTDAPAGPNRKVRGSRGDPLRGQDPGYHQDHGDNDESSDHISILVVILLVTVIAIMIVVIILLTSNTTIVVAKSASEQVVPKSKWFLFTSFSLGCAFLP